MIFASFAAAFCSLSVCVSFLDESSASVVACCTGSSAMSSRVQFPPSACVYAVNSNSTEAGNKGSAARFNGACGCCSPWQERCQALSNIECLGIMNQCVMGCRKILYMQISRGAPHTLQYLPRCINYTTIIDNDCLLTHIYTHTIPKPVSGKEVSICVILRVEGS